MKAIIVVLCAHVLLLKATPSSNSNVLVPLINLVEMDYTDTCEKRATASWEELIGSPKGLSGKMEYDKSFGKFVQDSIIDVKTAYNLSHASVDDLLKRKVELLLRPGDVAVKTEQWFKLVTFADTAQNKVRFATNYDCGDGRSNCTLREFYNSYVNENDDKLAYVMKQSWEKNLPDMKEYAEQILPLLRNASREYKSIEAYWDSLAEYEGAILKAKELWENIKPLYVKLHKYIASKLKGADNAGENLHVFELRSLIGDDWSNIIHKILPKHPAIYEQVRDNLMKKNLGGVHAFKAAANLIKELKLGEFKSEIWSESVFNATCPSTLVDWCKPNKLRVITCKDVSISNYLDAHETAMKIIYKQTMASYSNNTYILREAPRYSAIYEAIPGFIAMLGLSPHGIFLNELFSAELFDYNHNHHRMVLQLILALRDLPKLNYYLAVDEWRLKVLKAEISPSQAAADWAQYRREFSMLNSTGVEILADPYVVFNKPFIGKFMGLILKYQIYQSFAEEMESDDSDLVKHVGSNSGRLSDTMVQGFSVKWPEMVSDLLAQRENGLEYTGLTDYYRLLDEQLDTYFDTSINPEDIIDDYLEPPSETEPEDEYPFNLDDDAVVVDVPIVPDEKNGSIDVTVRSPVPVLAETTTKKNEPPKEESYNVYWWIGIGVALAVVVVLIAIIARKRHQHRKELERQRKANSRA